LIIAQFYILQQLVGIKLVHDLLECFNVEKLRQSWKSKHLKQPEEPDLVLLNGKLPIGEENDVVDWKTCEQIKYERLHGIVLSDQTDFTYDCIILFVQVLLAKTKDQVQYE
jgi:hypothetical protein